MKTLVWTGAEDTFARAKKADEGKAEFKVNVPVECDDECAQKLTKFDKRFVEFTPKAKAEAKKSE